MSENNAAEPPKDALGRHLCVNDVFLFAKLRGRSAEMNIGIVTRNHASSVTATIGNLHSRNDAYYFYRNKKILNVDEIIKLSHVEIDNLGLTDIVRSLAHQIEHTDDYLIKIHARLR